MKVYFPILCPVASGILNVLFFITTAYNIIIINS